MQGVLLHCSNDAVVHMNIVARISVSTFHLRLRQLLQGAVRMCAGSLQAGAAKDRRALVPGSQTPAPSCTGTPLDLLGGAIHASQLSYCLCCITCDWSMQGHHAAKHVQNALMLPVAEAWTYMTTQPFCQNMRNSTIHDF